MDFTHGRCNSLDVREALCHSLHHTEEHSWVEFGLFVHLRSLQGQPHLQILFISHQHVNVLDYPAEYTLCLLDRVDTLGSVGSPELCSVIKVEGDNRPCIVSRFHTFNDYFWCSLRE